MAGAIRNLLWLAFLGFLHTSESANIFAIFPHTGKSHYYMFEPYINKLASRGHNITVCTHFPPKKIPENVTYISLEGSAEILFNSFDMATAEMVSSIKEFASIIGLHAWGLDICEAGLNHSSIRQLIKSEPQFDLVIVEYFNTDCFAVLSHVFNAPLVGIFSSAMMPWHNDRFGNPDNPSYIVNHFLSYPSQMTLLERTKNSLLTFGAKIFHRVVDNWFVDFKIRKYLGDGIPPISQIIKNTSLFFINSHFSLFQPRPLVPGIIELGGIHVVPSKKLPDRLQKFLDDAKEGVVYFSLGSTIRGTTITAAKRKILNDAFSKIPMKVLWKWEDDDMPEKASNVYLEKWLPQNDILGHPNVKLFVTHAGLMGTEEAIYHGVPMVLMPIFGDQPLNAASCAEKGLGLVVDFFSLTEEALLKALKTVLEDKSYAENSKKVAAIFKDRPLSIMDTAIYWTEYVLRHKGAPHLRSAAVHLPWYSEYLLDVALVIALSIYLIIYILKKSVKIVRSLRGKTKQKQN